MIRPACFVQILSAGRPRTRLCVRAASCLRAGPLRVRANQILHLLTHMASAAGHRQSFCLLHEPVCAGLVPNAELRRY